jgi:hypothetical protein
MAKTANGVEKDEPAFTPEERQAARVKMDEGKARIQTAREQLKQDVYALGVAARALVEDEGLAPRLDFPSTRALLDAELPRIGADSLIRAVLYVRLVDEGGLPKPSGGSVDIQVPVPREIDGLVLQRPFRQCSLEDLQRALARLKKAAEPPPAPAPPPPPVQAPAPVPVAVAAPPPSVRPVAAAPAPAPVAVPAPAPPVKSEPPRSGGSWRYAAVAGLLLLGALIAWRCL